MDNQWSFKAACRDKNSAIFFPHFTGNLENQRSQAFFAIQICNGCPVKKECEFANKDVPDGVFFGTVPSERNTEGPSWPSELRAEAAQGVHYTKLMRKYGISRSQVYKIINNQSRVS